MWLVATILGQHRFGEQGGYWWAWSLKAYFPFLFSKAVTEISSMVRENDFPVSLWPPITSQEAGFAYLDRFCFTPGKKQAMQRDGEAKSRLFGSQCILGEGKKTEGNAAPFFCDFIQSDKLCWWVEGSSGGRREKIAALAAFPFCPCSQTLTWEWVTASIRST